MSQFVQSINQNFSGKNKDKRCYKVKQHVSVNNLQSIILLRIIKFKIILILFLVRSNLKCNTWDSSLSKAVKQIR